MQRINCKNGDYWYIVSEQDRGDGVINCIIESNYGERFNLTSNFPKNAEKEFYEQLKMELEQIGRQNNRPKNEA
jgi:hypothetical protein